MGGAVDRLSPSRARPVGEDAYRAFLEQHLDDTLAPGDAYPFIDRLLSLHDLADPDDPLVEVIVLSRNETETGLRVMRSIRTHDLSITRAIFMQGRSPYAFMPALNMSLFLSANQTDVREAVARRLPAGQVLRSTFVDDGDRDLRIGFDFDGVLADDASERIFREYRTGRLPTAWDSNAVSPIGAGPLRDFLANVNRIQRREQQRQRDDPTYRVRLYVSIVTSRNAPGHERAVASLKAWGSQSTMPSSSAASTRARSWKC